MRVDFEADERAVGVDDAFVQAEEVVVFGIEGQVAGVGSAAGSGGELGEVILVVSALGEVEGADGSSVAGDVEKVGRSCSCQRCGREDVADENFGST